MGGHPVSGLRNKERLLSVGVNPVSLRVFKNGAEENGDNYTTRSFTINIPSTRAWKIILKI
jgi:hypothetical protein